MMQPLDELNDVAPAAERKGMFRFGHRARSALVLTGPRSVGKTTTAMLVAQQLELPWYDTDVSVNTGLAESFGDALGPIQLGAPLPYLTAAMSKQRFDWIAQVLQETCSRLSASRSNYILAVAGGAFSYAAVAAALRDGAVVVGLLPSMESSFSTSFLLERERCRPHFRGVPDAEIAQSYRNHFQQVVKLLRAHADDVMFIDMDAPSVVAARVVDRYLSR